MAHTGGYSPAPRRNGGSIPDLQHRVESLGAQLGIGPFDVTTWGTSVQLWLQAVGRALWAAFEQNRRMALQWDPVRMTDFLPRWERILALTPLQTDTATQRRARVGLAMGRVGYATLQAVTDACATALGSNFVQIVTQSSATANVWTPPGWPVGSHAPTNLDGSPGSPDWYSSIAMVMVQVQKVPNQTDAQFFDVMKQVVPLLDGIMPAWVVFDWFRQDISSRAGFWLDEIDLDEEAFDV